MIFLLLKYTTSISSFTFFVPGTPSGLQQGDEMHAMSAISALTAGSVANSKHISIVGGRIKDKES